MVSLGVCAHRDKDSLFLMLLRPMVATHGNVDTMHLKEPYVPLWSRLIQSMKVDFLPSMKTIWWGTNPLTCD